MGDENAKDDTKILEDARKLGMAQRIEHKLWKVRAEAYDDMKNTCQKILSSDDPALSEYGELVSLSLSPGALFLDHENPNIGPGIFSGITLFDKMLLDLPRWHNSG